MLATRAAADLLNFESSEFRYDPYPIGFARHVLPTDLYQELVESYPELHQLIKREGLGNKYLLSEHDGRAFRDFVAGRPAWREFYRYIKSPRFVRFMLEYLLRTNVDLALEGIPFEENNLLKSRMHRMSTKASRLIRQLATFWRSGQMYLTSHFEFGAFPGNGGSQYPHTDTPRKVISLVLSMVKEGEWDPDWGGGTAIVRPKDPKQNYNFVNRYLGFDDVDVIDAFPFAPNCCVIFVKTFNSWHAVMPIRASASEAIRKTVVINVNIIGPPGTRL